MPHPDPRALHHPHPEGDPMTTRISVERSPAFDAPWLVLGPVKGRPLVLAYFYDWAEAIRYAHHYAERSRA